MKTRYVSLLIGGVLLLAACSGAPAAPTTTTPAGMAMCAEGVTDCVDVIVEPGTGEMPETDPSRPNVAVPTGNAIDPQPITEAALDGFSADSPQLSFRVSMGVEPCDVIDRVEVTETADAVDVVIFHGIGDIAATCIAMAQERIVLVDLASPLGARTVTYNGVASGA